MTGNSSSSQKIFDQTDHVAIILRYPGNCLVLLEAVGNHGVILTKWDSMTEPTNNIGFEKVVFRKLRCQRSQSFLRGVEEFTKAVLGKGYNVPTNKMLLKRKNPKVDPKDYPTFFCSELVAEALQHMRVIPDETVNSNECTPKDFDERASELLRVAFA